MSTEEISTSEKPRKTKIVYQNRTSEAVYGLGMIGAWVYYIGQASSFGMGVLGFLKGIVWPAILVYEVLKYLN